MAGSNYDVNIKLDVRKINQQINNLERRISKLNALAQGKRGDSKILLKKRTGKKILANQWEIPSTNWKVKPVKFSKKSTPIPNAKWKKTNVEFKHSFSHIDLKNTVYKSNINNSQIQFNEDDLKWVDLKKLNKYAVTTMSKKALNLLNLIQI